MGNNLAFQKAKQELPYDSAVLLPCIFLKELESKDSEIFELICIAALFNIAKYSSMDK